MDAGSTDLGARILGVIKERPLWLLVAIALSLSVVLAVPDFRGLIFATVVPLICLVVIAWIFVIARAAKPTFDAISAYRKHREGRQLFFISPIEQQCHWAISKQPDGSYVTQFSARCLIKNRSSEPLYPTSARIIRPRIRGEVIPHSILIEGDDRRTYGSVGISGNRIPQGDTRRFNDGALRHRSAI
jgi:hypothetical protein